MLHFDSTSLQGDTTTSKFILLTAVPDERAYICTGNHHEMVARYVYGWCIIKYILYTFTLPTQTLFYYNQMPKPSANARICLHTYRGDIPRRQT